MDICNEINGVKIVKQAIFLYILIFSKILIYHLKTIEMNQLRYNIKIQSDLYININLII